MQNRIRETPFRSASCVKQVYIYEAWYAKESEPHILPFSSFIPQASRVSLLRLRKHFSSHPFWYLPNPKLPIPTRHHPHHPDAPPHRLPKTQPTQKVHLHAYVVIGGGQNAEAWRSVGFFDAVDVESAGVTGDGKDEVVGAWRGRLVDGLGGEGWKGTNGRGGSWGLVVFLWRQDRERGPCSGCRGPCLGCRRPRLGCGMSTCLVF